MSKLEKQFGPLDKLASPDTNATAHELRVPIVGPNGEFKVVRCGPGHENTSGDRPLIYSSEIGRPEIPERYAKKGWVKYADICRDAPEYFDKWQRTDDADRRGMKLRKLPPDFYHPEVYRRRQEVDRGRPVVDVQALLDAPKRDASPQRKRVA